MPRYDILGEAVGAAPSIQSVVMFRHPMRLCSWQTETEGTDIGAEGAAGEACRKNVGGADLQTFDSVSDPPIGGLDLH